MATLIKTNGDESEALPANGKSFTLEELQKFVGGNIEIHAAKDGRLIVMNKEGKLLGGAFNPKATELYVYGDRDVILGDVLVGTEKELGDDEAEQPYNPEDELN